MHGTLDTKSRIDLITVPLFETIGDLRNAAPIMSDFYTLPGIANLIKRSGGEQDIMLATRIAIKMAASLLVIGSCIVLRLHSLIYLNA